MKSNNEQKEQPVKIEDHYGPEALLDIHKNMSSGNIKGRDGHIVHLSSSH